MKLQLGDVEETALIPLSNRASETQRKHPRICDAKAVDIVQSLQLELKQYDKLVTHECVIARTIMFDRAVKNFIVEHPHGVCINLGCGMDDRFSRVDNGYVQWFDVDLPDSISVRKKVFSETKRRKMISADVLEDDWVREVSVYIGERGEDILVIAEGLLMYFTKEQHRKLLQMLADSFSSGVLLVELMKPCMMNEKKHQTVKKTNAKFGWGIDCGSELEKLEPRMYFIRETSFSQQMRQSTIISKLLGVLLQKVNNRMAEFQWGK